MHPYVFLSIVDLILLIIYLPYFSPHDYYGVHSLCLFSNVYVPRKSHAQHVPYRVRTTWLFFHWLCLWIWMCLHPSCSGIYEILQADSEESKCMEDVNSCNNITMSMISALTLIGSIFWFIYSPAFRTFF